MSCNSLKRHLVILSAACLFAVGCGDESSSHHGDSPDGAAGEAGESSAGAAGACESCQAGEGGEGGADGPGAGGEGGAGSACDPEAVQASSPSNARRARSAGFQGSSQDYLELFDVPCTVPTDCASACADAGGQKVMCDAAECLPNLQAAGSACAPAPVWDNLGGIQAEDASTANMCQLILVNTTYRDALLTDQFKLELPHAAVVRGITVDVRRAGDDSVSDDSVRIIKDGKVGAAERALPQTWSPDIAWITYGGPTDLWGEQWTAADLNSDQFGVALSAAYGKNVGNTLAYVDHVRVTVSYELPCD